MKYPWIRKNEPDFDQKWGAYQIDKDDFDFAREMLVGLHRSAEAELMDWADDIAYSVHDIEDFHRCGAIPWHSIFAKDARNDLGSRAEELVSRATAAWYQAPLDAQGRLRDAIRSLQEFIRGGWAVLIDEPYEGTRSQREGLRSLTSSLIGRYIHALQLSSGERTVDIGRDEADEIKILKQITRDYIISNPALVAQQTGHKRVVDELFRTLFEDCQAGPPKYLPTRLSYLWLREITRARFVADCIASLTEAEAIGLYGRLSGQVSGSVLDPIVR